MIISDLDYLESIQETDTMHVNGGDAVATSNAVAFASGKSTATNVFSRTIAISKLGFSLAASSSGASAKSTGGSAFAASSSSSSVG